MSTKLSSPPTIPIRTAGQTHPQPLPGRLSGVLFDTCNVLYDDTVWRRWVLQLLAHLGVHTNYCCFFRVWDREYLDDVHRGRRAFRDAFEAFLLSIGLSRGQIDEVAAACLVRRRHLQKTARPLPGVKKTLARLHESGVTLGAVANCERPAEQIADCLRQFGIERLFATVVSSIDVEATMPEPACYRAALGAMGRPVEEVVFVGHDAAQLAGAAALGMPTVAFNYDPDAAAHTYVDRFDHLVDVIVKTEAAAPVVVRPSVLPAAG